MKIECPLSFSSSVGRKEGKMQREKMEKIPYRAQKKWKKKKKLNLLPRSIIILI